MWLLSLYNNQISDVSSLAGLTDVFLLDINNNRVTDISSLSRLTALDQFYLERNQVGDISVVSNFLALTVLRFNDNQVADISSLRSLGGLREVTMSGNQVEDLAALVENQGVGLGDTVNVTGNPLGEEALYVQIPELRNRGVVVIHANIPPKAEAGSGQSAGTGDRVVLDGSGSFDPDGDELSYQWAQESGPSVDVTDSDQVDASFSPTEPGSYVFSLVVNDGQLSSLADQVTVSVFDSDELTVSGRVLYNDILVEGALVELLDEEHVLIDSLRSSAGTYVFHEVDYGTYILRVTHPSGE